MNRTSVTLRALLPVTAALFWVAEVETACAQAKGKTSPATQTSRIMKPDSKPAVSPSGKPSAKPDVLPTQPVRTAPKVPVQSAKPNINIDRKGSVTITPDIKIDRKGSVTITEDIRRKGGVTITEDIVRQGGVTVTEGIIRKGGITVTDDAIRRNAGNSFRVDMERPDFQMPGLIPRSGTGISPFDHHGLDGAAKPDDKLDGKDLGLKPDAKVDGKDMVGKPFAPPGIDAKVDAQTLNSRINAVGKSVENEIYASNNTVNDIRTMLASGVIGKKDAHELSKKIESHLERIGVLIIELDTVNDHTEMDTIDLENCLQKTQQYNQMLSNIMKALNDTSTAIIRNMK